MDTETKRILLAIGLAVPILFFLFQWFHPPQCPLEYTQEQIDASHCIIGANIGGTPLFLISIPITLGLTSFIAQKILERKNKK